MTKKIFKWVGWMVAMPLALFLIAATFLYVPAIQNAIVGKVISYASGATGMAIRVDNVRLGFPLDLWINGVEVLTEQHDTLLTAQSIRVDVQALPLLRKQVEVDGVSLYKVGVNTRDLIPSVCLRGSLGKFYLSSHGVALGPEEATVNKLLLHDTDLHIQLRDTAATDTTASAPVYWKILLKELDSHNVRVTLHLSDTTSLAAGWQTLQAKDGLVDLHANAYRLDRLAMTGGLFAMDNDTLPPAAGLDADHLQVKDLDLELDSLVYAGQQVGATIARCSAKERSGLEIVSLQGVLRTDSAGVHVPRLRLETTDSYLETQASLDWKALEAGSGGVLSARLLAGLGKQDVLLLAGGMPQAFVRQYPNHPLTVRAGVDGNMDSLHLTGLQTELRGAFALRATGKARNLLDSLSRQATVDWSGETHNLQFLTALSDSLSSTLSIPPLALNGHLRMEADRYVAGVSLDEGRGVVDLEASYRTGTEEYAATLSVDSLLVKDFMPHDSLGYVSAVLDVKGKGFDFYSPRTYAMADVQLHQFQYAAYDLKGISLDAVLEKGQAAATLSSHNEWLQMTTTLGAKLVNRLVEARLAMDVERADLQGLNITPFPFQTQWQFGLDVRSNLNDNHTVEGSFRDFQFEVAEGKRFKTKDLFFNTVLAPDSTCVDIHAGDLNVHLHGKSNVNHIANALSVFGKELMEQAQNKWLDQNGLKRLLPELCLAIRAGQDNPVYNYLNLYGLGYDKFFLDIDTSPVEGMNGGAYLYSLRADSLRLDTIRFNIRQDTLGVKTLAEVRNAPTNKQFVFDARLNTFIHPKGAACELNFYNGKGEQGIHLGMNTSMVEDGIRMKFYPAQPTIAFRKFNLNRDNFIQFRKDGRVDANVFLENDEKTGFRFYSSEDSGAKQDLTVDLYRLDLGELMTVLPYLPDITGIWNAELHYMEGNEGQSFVVETSVDSLTYQKQPIGNVACQGIYLPKTGNDHFVDARVAHNGLEVMALTGDYHNDAGGLLDMSMDLTHFPLTLANGFIPDGMVALDGDLDGELSVRGKTDAPLVNGQLALDSVTIVSDIYGVRFRMDNRPVQIKDSRMLFDKFSVYTRGKNPFMLDGSIDFSNLADASVDLRMVARDYELVNAPRTKHSVVYGKVYVDIFSTLEGSLDRLKMRGNLNVQGKTDVTYVLKDSPLTVEDRLSGLVTFVNFNDTVAVVPEQEALANAGGIDMLMTLQISEGAHVRVDLSEDRESYISLYGGGTLSMQYTPQGEMLLSGRYTVVSGDMKYALPIIPLKTFSLKNGSYVEFSGNPMNPRMNIVATERVRSTVTENDVPRSVNFDVGIAITNSLENMGLEFTMEAPEDLSLQNTLAAMSKEERGKLAVAMLATGMYLGEGGGGGYSNGGFDANNALNSFLQSEINSIAGSALKTVDISLGMEDVTGADGSQHKDYSFRFAKRFWNNRLSVVIGGRISTGDDTEDTGNGESFIDDVSLEWRLDDSGTRYVRIFHNTNFDSMLDGEVTETGGGIVLRRRMTKLGELFIFRKKKPAVRMDQETTTKTK